MIGTIFQKNDHDPNAYAIATDWCDQNLATIEDKGDHYEIVALPAPTLAEQKTYALRRAQIAFAKKRDAIRWVNGYGYDCAPDDITNFMAAYTPLLVAGTGTTQYKVWLTETEKAIVTLTADDMTRVYNTVRTSQFEDYAWYETVRTQINDAQTEEELASILREAGIIAADAGNTEITP